ncbi:S-layer homology domain-containing protein [Salibacterium halotolerans]|uniref:S-layer homology domain-containing protein n=1 Tax=Salibacterium halotolerans TaxID=1884432 RepID=A0A1I5XWQ1_9BACI|nr:S-layer homology domain-containing protein [Salibacterium halotolerans]SFQ36300.1 S-layer homology domain-containing protein [Salibacterium halotolerans]
MAYQPKSYRRFLASSVSAAVVASAAAAVPADVQQADAAESFSDVSNDYWASESIQRLADEGIINGYPDGTYGPGEDINRGQVAELLVNAFDLEVSQDAESSYDDLTDESYYTPYAEAVTEAGYITGREDGTMFAAGMDLSREQMATILVRAFNLEPKEDASANVADLDEANASHQENIEILAQYDITSTENNMFRPKETVNRAQFATFLDRALEVQEPLEIANVSTLTGDGHVLSVEFTRPYREDLSPSDIMISESDSGERKGVESVSLSSDGLSAEVTLYDDTSDNAPDEIPEGVQHDIQVGNLSTTFTRDQFLNDDDNARVTGVDQDERTITVTYNEDNGEGQETTVQIDVPEDSDLNFQQALGHEISVWYDGDEQLTRYQLIQHEDTVHDAIEVTADNEIETIDEGNAHDLAVDSEQFEFIANPGTDDEVVANSAEDMQDLVDNKYDYSKAIFGDNGDVERVYAYDLNADPILVDNVEDGLVTGKGGNELDLQDYVIVKNGQQISASDLQEDDLLFFNEDAHGDGFAVVSNQTTSGSIENVFEDSFEVDGTSYDYVSDNITTRYLEGDEFSELDESAAQDLQAANDEVTLYNNFRNEVVYVTGNQGDAPSNENYLYLQGDLTPYTDNLGNGRMEIEGINSEGESELYDVELGSLDQINLLEGQSGDDSETEYEMNSEFPGNSDYEVDDFVFGTTHESAATSNSATVEVDGTTYYTDISDRSAIENIIAVNEDNSYGEIITDISDVNNIANIGLDGEDSDTVNQITLTNNVETLNEDIDEDSSTANGYRLQDDTMIYDLSDADDMEDPDADNVEVTAWSDASNIDITADNADVYYDEEGNVTHIVSSDSVTANDDEVSALISEVSVSDGDVERVTAFVEGEKIQFEVDDSDINLEEGSFETLEVNEDRTVITGKADDQKPVVDGYVEEVNVGAGEIKFFGNDTTYELNNDNAVYDGTDDDSGEWETANLRDIEEGDSVSISIPSEGSRFADAAVLEEEDSVDPDTYEPSVNVNQESVTSTSAENVSEVKLSFSEEASVQEDGEFTVTDEDGNSFTVTEDSYEQVGSDNKFTYQTSGSTVSVYVYGYDEADDANPLNIDFSGDNFFDESYDVSDSSVNVNVNDELNN